MTVRSLQSSSAAERERLLDDFVRLCEIESPSQHERPMADAVKAELEGLGLAVDEDDSGSETGSEAGNLLARIAGPRGLPHDPALRPPRHGAARAAESR